MSHWLLWLALLLQVWEGQALDVEQPQVLVGKPALGQRSQVGPQAGRQAGNSSEAIACASNSNKPVVQVAECPASTVLPAIHDGRAVSV